MRPDFEWDCSLDYPLLFFLGLLRTPCLFFVIDRTPHVSPILLAPPAFRSGFS